MSLKNLVQYVKIGLGTALTTLGIQSDFGILSTRQAFEEAMYRSLEIVNPEALAKAYQQLDQYLLKHSSLEEVVIASGFIFIGTGLLASGIYNLAKKKRIYE